MDLAIALAKRGVSLALLQAAARSQELAANIKLAKCLLHIVKQALLKG